MSRSKLAGQLRIGMIYLVKAFAVLLVCLSHLFVVGCDRSSEQEIFVKNLERVYGPDGARTKLILDGRPLGFVDTLQVVFDESSKVDHVGRGIQCRLLVQLAVPESLKLGDGLAFEAGKGMKLDDKQWTIRDSEKSVVGVDLSFSLQLEEDFESPLIVAERTGRKDQLFNEIEIVELNRLVKNVVLGDRKDFAYVKVLVDATN